MEDDGEQFRMSERQRVRGTAVAAHFSEACGNLVAKQLRLHTKKSIPYAGMLFLSIFYATAQRPAVIPVRQT